MLPVVMETRCLDARQWRGPVGMTLGSSLYMDFSRDELLPQVLQQIFSAILRRVKPILVHPMMKTASAMSLHSSSSVVGGWLTSPRPNITITATDTIDNTDDNDTAHIIETPYDNRHPFFSPTAATSSGIKKPLTSLTVDEVADLMTALHLPNEAISASRSEQLDGELLAILQSEEELEEALKQPIPTLKARLLLNKLALYKEDGVPLSALQASPSSSSHVRGNGQHCFPEDNAAAVNRPRTVSNPPSIIKVDEVTSFNNVPSSSSRRCSPVTTPHSPLTSSQQAQTQQNSQSLDHTSYNGRESENALRLRELAAKGDSAAQSNLAFLYFQGGEGIAKDPAVAVRWWTMSAEACEVNAMNSLANRYWAGEGCKRDHVQAVHWWRLAAEEGNLSAAFNLGNCYCQGDGTTQNYTEAVHWWKLAADLGDNPAAMNSLAIRLANGEGTEQNYTQAIQYWKRAADKGHTGAMNNLGLKCFNGEGCDQDVEQAVKWFQQASDLGDMQATNNLGECYRDGDGVPQDNMKAKELFERAAGLGYAPAQSNLDHVST